MIKVTKIEKIKNSKLFQLKLINFIIKNNSKIKTNVKKQFDKKCFKLIYLPLLCSCAFDNKEM